METGYISTRQTVKLKTKSFVKNLIIRYVRIKTIICACECRLATPPGCRGFSLMFLLYLRMYDEDALELKLSRVVFKILN